MRIALVILHADPARGGAERYTIDLAAALTREGHDVSLLAASFHQVPGGVAQVRLDHHGITRAGRYKNFLDSLDAHVHRVRYDIVHAMLPVRRCDVYHPHAGVAVDMAAPSDAILRPRRRAMADVERELLHRDDGPLVLCLSVYVQGHVRACYPLPETRLPILFNAIDVERFNPSLFPREAGARGARMLMIANEYERKGLAAALRAVAMLHDEAVTLDVVGKEPPGRYGALTAELGLSRRVAFHPVQSDPRSRYAAADVFVLPTKHDPCSLVVLEALAMGLPVISTRFNGACEIMTDGVHGYVLDDPNDVRALADAMRKMLDGERRAKMAQACLELRPKLSYNNHLWSLLNIYRDVARRSKAAPFAPKATTAPSGPAPAQ